ncbi:hypothetical protein DMUE_3368 [Dictyocoela muelleri]|nr:hypothetical protein DMUE_3368 [Dictyocoela muelleri]
MVKKINIKNEKEKEMFINYLKNWIINENLYGARKRNFVEKVKLMKVEDDNLFILDRGIYKTYLGSYENIRAKVIIYNSHNPFHLSADKLYTKISQGYIGINRDMIREYVRKCEACNMAGN